MKRRIIFLFFALVGLTGIFFPQFTVTAQNAAVKCGDIIKGELTKQVTNTNQVQAYPILLSPGDKITVSGQADGTSKLNFGITLDSPAGTRIFPRNDADVKISASPVLVTGRMSAYGLHTIYVFNSGYVNADNQIGAYQVAISCELNDGTIVAAGDTSYTPAQTRHPKSITLPITTIQGNSLKQLQCGDVIASEYIQNEQINTYLLEMAPGDVSFQISIQPLGDGLWVAALVSDPSSKAILGTHGREYGYYAVEPTIQLTVPISTPGNYHVSISNTALSPESKIKSIGNKDFMGGIGIFTLYISCTLKGNKVIAPDPDKIQQVTEQLTSDSAAPAEPTTVTTTTNPTPAPVPTEAAVTTTTTETVTCPASPLSHLYIGAHGKVAPGEANNLRDEPSGKILSKIQPGIEFDVLEGPVCGKTGLTFWKVQSGDQIGWTAEGQGAEYWLELIEDGRG